MPFWFTLNLILFNEQIPSKSHPDPDFLTDRLRDERRQQSREMGYCWGHMFYSTISIQSVLSPQDIFYTFVILCVCVCECKKFEFIILRPIHFHFVNSILKRFCDYVAFALYSPSTSCPKSFLILNPDAYISTLTVTESVWGVSDEEANAWTMLKCVSHFSLPSEFFSWKNIILFFCISAYFMQIELEMPFNPAYLRCEKCNKGEICWQR